MVLFLFLSLFGAIVGLKFYKKYFNNKADNDDDSEGNGDDDSEGNGDDDSDNDSEDVNEYSSDTSVDNDSEDNSEDNSEDVKDKVNEQKKQNIEALKILQKEGEKKFIEHVFTNDDGKKRTYSEMRMLYG